MATRSHTYDAAGNRIKTGGSFARSGLPPALATTTYNANNQQTMFGASTETYDLNGNLATVTEAGITTTYSWNARNQLTGISNPGFSALFTYDSFGRRTGKTILGTTINFVYDGLNPVQEKSGSTVTANLLTGLGIDEFFQRTDGVGARALLTDALGSTIALGDGTGSLVTQYTYEPFGVTSETGATSTNSYKYTGREDDGSGLLYYRARYYHPRLQRFISEDPIGFGGGSANVYAYVSANPLTYTDPLGLWRWPSDIFNDAMNDTSASFPHSQTQHNDSADAYRHCLASCMMTRENSEFEARVFGWMNEKLRNIASQQERGEEHMDNNNNAIGRECGRTAQSTGDCSSGCMNALVNGRLINSYRPGWTRPYW